MLNSKKASPAPAEHGVFVLNSYVRELGNNEARVFSQLLYWLDGRAKKTYEDRTWVFKTYADWGYETGLSESAAKRAMKKIVDRGLVVRRANPYHGWDKTPWYAVDADALAVFEEVLEFSEAALTANRDEAHGSASPADAGVSGADDLVPPVGRNRRLMETIPTAADADSSDRADESARAIPEMTTGDHLKTAPAKSTPEMSSEKTSETTASPAFSSSVTERLHGSRSSRKSVTKELQTSPQSAELNGDHNWRQEIPVGVPQPHQAFPS